MYQLETIDLRKVLLCVVHLSLAVWGCFVPMVLLFNTLVYAASNIALSVAILTQKGAVNDEVWDLAATLILQGVLMTIACSLVLGICTNPVALFVVIAVYVGCYAMKTHAYMMDLVDNQLAASDLKGVTAPLVVEAFKKANMSDWAHVSIIQ